MMELNQSDRIDFAPSVTLVVIPSQNDFPVLQVRLLSMLTGNIDNKPLPDLILNGHICFKSATAHFVVP